MAQCVVFNGASYVPSQAVPCDGLVLLDPAEAYLATSSPFSLSIQDGFLIGGAIAAVWGTAWAIRAVARVLQSDGEAIEE